MKPYLSNLSYLRLIKLPSNFNHPPFCIDFDPNSSNHFLVLNYPHGQNSTFSDWFGEEICKIYKISWLKMSLTICFLFPSKYSWEKNSSVLISLIRSFMWDGKKFVNDLPPPFTHRNAFFEFSSMRKTVCSKKFVTIWRYTSFYLSFSN